MDYDTPIVLPIRDKKYECVWPDTLPWDKYAEWCHCSYRFDALRGMIRRGQSPAQDDAAEVTWQSIASELGPLTDAMLGLIIPTMSPRTLKKLHSGEKFQAVASFLALESPVSQKIAAEAMLSLLRGQKQTESSPDSAGPSDSPQSTSSD